MAATIAALCIGLVSSTAVPDALAQDEEVSWTISAPEYVPESGRFAVIFEASISSGWYIYALDSPAGRPARILVEDLPEGFSAGEPSQTGPVEGYDQNFDATVRYFEDYAQFQLPLIVDRSASPGVHTIAGSIEYMYCSDRVCIPASEPFLTDVELTTVVDRDPSEVEAAEPPAPDSGSIGEDSTDSGSTGDAAAGSGLSGEAAAGSGLSGEAAAGSGLSGEAAAGSEAGADAPPPSGSIADAPNDLDTARSGGLLGFLLIAIGAGIAALLTPCVFPMIPLTISFFSHQADNRAQTVRMALIFGLSIVVIFTGLGVLMALVFGAAGAQLIASNPWINLAIGVVFIVFALSLLGMFELRLPNRFVNYVNRKGDTRSGVLGVLFMGLTLTLVSFSCTAPFVGGLLAATATTAEWSWPVLGMLVFSATFAAPFVLFAMFPNWLAGLPRSGSWMNAVKVTLGFVELAAAFKFLSNADLVWGWGLLSRTLVIAAWIVIFAMAGMYLLGKLKLIHDEPVERIGTVRMLVAIAFFGFSLYLLPGLLGAPLNNIDAFLPPRLATDVSLSSLVSRDSSGDTVDGLDWKGNDKQSYESAIDDAFEDAGAEGKPILIDFTGYTCTNCRQMEANVFPDPAVAERLKTRFVLLRLFTDDAADGPDLQRYQLQLTGTVALPTYAVVDSDGRLLQRWLGMASVEEFTEFLDTSTKQFASLVY